MKKIKFVLPAASLLAIAGLVSCGNNRDIKPQYNISFANCYSKDRTEATNEMVKAGESVFPAWAYPKSSGGGGGGGEDEPDVQIYQVLVDGNGFHISDNNTFTYQQGWEGDVTVNESNTHIASLSYILNDNNEDIKDFCQWETKPDADTFVRSAHLSISPDYCTSNYRVGVEVQPNEKLLAVNGEKKPEPVVDPTEEDVIEGGIFGYVGNIEDKGNTGQYTLTGNSTFQLGEDVDVTMTLDEFTYLNPIDGELVETTDEETGKITYSIKNPKYFKIYVAESDTHRYDELKEEYYEIKWDENNPSVINFHIKGEYVRFSYKVYFSASYLDPTSEEIGFGGFMTIPYSMIKEGAPSSEYEKFVDGHSGYRITNKRVGKDLTCVISPSGMEGGISFTQEYLNKLAFYGIKENKETHKVTLKDITDTVHTNLIHNYVRIGNPQNDPVFGTFHTNATYATNQYACRVAMPWTNSEHPELGIFKQNSDGTYTLNFDRIGVNVKEEYVSDAFPTYIAKEEIKTKFKVSPDADTIGKATLDYFYDPSGTPTVSIDIETKQDCEFSTSVVNSIKITSKTDDTGRKYFKDFEITDSESIVQLLINGDNYITDDDYCLYNFAGSYYFDADATSPNTKGKLRLQLPSILRSIALGPTSYGYVDLLADNPYTFCPNALNEGSQATIDMVESFEIGIFAQNTKIK